MATHSSVLAWKIPWTEEPSGVNPKSIFAAHRGSKFEVPDVCISAETLPSCFSSHTVNKYLLRGLFSTIFCIVVLFSDDFTV